ncbi:MAG TPA: hypothetical protein VMW52_10875 [Phycisphaerae bacterium]|nr:hypothetical protein [Phycisphaerae bacterium]
MATDFATRTMAAWKRRGATESLTVTPAAPAAARAVDALVEREGRPEDLLTAASMPLRVTLIHDATAGVTPTIDLGATTISVAERLGGTPAARLIRRIVGQDLDFVVLEL